MKKLLPLLLAGLLWASPSQAGWTLVGAMAVGNDTTADNTLGPITITNTLEAGNIGVCVIAADEIGAGTTDGAANAQITGMTDSVGNTWTEGAEWCNMQTSTTLNGACVAIYITKATTQLTGGSGTISATFPGSVRKAITCVELTVTSGNTWQGAAGGNGVANDAADPGSLSDATGVNQAHLFIRGTACESNNTGYTADTDYTGFAGSTTTSTANTGTTGTSMGARGETRIATESTSAASDPTYVAADCASLIAAVNEITPASCSLSTALTGVGCR